MSVTHLPHVPQEADTRTLHQLITAAISDNGDDATEYRTYLRSETLEATLDDQVETHWKVWYDAAYVVSVWTDRYRYVVEFRQDHDTGEVEWITRACPFEPCYRELNSVSVNPAE